MEIKVDVQVGDVDLTTVIGERSRYDHDAEERVAEPVTLGDAVAARITAKLTAEEHYGVLRNKVVAMRDEEIRAQLAPIVATAIESNVQRTNTYGQAVGEPTTLTTLIIDEVKTYLSRTDGYGDRATNVLQKTIREAVDKAIRTELAAVIADEKARVVTAVRAKAAELIAQAVKEGIGR